MSELEAILDRLDAEGGSLSLDPVRDDATGQEFWEMEIDGRWFAARSAKACFLKAVREFWDTPETPERVSR